MLLVRSTLVKYEDAGIWKRFLNEKTFVGWKTVSLSNVLLTCVHGKCAEWREEHKILLVTHLELLDVAGIPQDVRHAGYKWLKSLLEGNQRRVIGTYRHLAHGEKHDKTSVLRQLEYSFQRVVLLSTKMLDSQPDDGQVTQYMSKQEFWSQVVGFDKVKDELEQYVRWRWLRRDHLSRMGLLSSGLISGVLVHGPPSCGKTFLCQQFRRERHVNFIQVKASQVFSKWLGDSEKTIRDVFKQARSESPCVLFMDEIEALAPKRHQNVDGQDGVGLRILSTLLNELDGVDTRDNELVVIGATTNIGRVDDAILRPGRLGNQVLVDYPDAEDRLLLLKHFTKRIPLDSDVQLDVLVASTATCSVARMKNICSMACFQALKEGTSRVRMGHFQQHLLQLGG